MNNNSAAKAVCVVANSGFTVLNFRRELISAFQAKGWTVWVICPKECNLMPGQDLHEKFSEIGVNFESCEMSRTGTNPIPDLKTCFDLYELFRKIRPVIVLNFTVKPVIYGSIAARFAGVPKTASNITGIGSILTAPTSGLKNRILSRVLFFLYRVSLRSNHSVFFQNPDDLELFASNKLVAVSRAVLLNGSGVDLNRFKPSEQTKSEHGRFLFIGRLLLDKGIHEFIKAAEILKAEFPEAEFSILGPVDEGKGGLSEDDVDALAKSGHVTFFPAADDVIPFLHKNDVLVLPSYREGTPRAVLEAMACGLAIVTTDAPGCRETVIDGENGYLVPVQSVNDLADAMERFLSDRELAGRMGKRSIKIAREKYDVQVVVGKVLSRLELN